MDRAHLNQALSRDTDQSRLDRIDDLLIAGAAADVVLQLLFDLIIRGMGILVQQGFDGHDDAGGAEAALIGMVDQERGLDGMQVLSV